MEIKSTETKKYLTISISEDEAAVLAAAARNFYEARKAYVMEMKVKAVNLKGGYAILLSDLGVKLAKALDHQKNEEVWNYATISTASPGPVSSNGDPI